MPVVSEIVVHTPWASKGRVPREHVHYVEPSAVTADMEVLELSDMRITSAMRGEFETYPEFGGEASAPKGATLAASDLADMGMFTDAQWKDAIAMVHATEESQELAKMYQAEHVRANGPRKSVLGAFRAKGLGDAADFGN